MAISAQLRALAVRAEGMLLHQMLRSDACTGYEAQLTAGQSRLHVCKHYMWDRFAPCCALACLKDHTSIVYSMHD